MLNQGLYVAVALEHLHAPQTAGEHQHIHRLPVQLGQGQVGGDSDAVGAGDGGAVHAHQSDLNACPAQQIGFPTESLPCETAPFFSVLLS